MAYQHSSKVAYRTLKGGEGGSYFDDQESLDLHAGLQWRIKRIKLYSSQTGRLCGMRVLYEGLLGPAHSLSLDRGFCNGTPADTLELGPLDYITEVYVGYQRSDGTGFVHGGVQAVRFVSKYDSASVGVTSNDMPGALVPLAAPQNTLVDPRLASMFGRDSSTRMVWGVPVFNPWARSEPIHALGCVWVGRAVQPRHGENDAAVATDALGGGSAAKGAASFLLDQGTPAMTMAIYGPWGSGKSSFMRLIEQQLHLQAAAEQVSVIGTRHAERAFEAIRMQLLEPSTSTEVKQRLLRHIQALSSPRLMTVWFNAWQYLNEDQVWSGLVVEVTQRIEEKLGPRQRFLMLFWWWAVWGRMAAIVFTPMATRAAISYNWRTRKMVMIFRCILPVLAVLLVTAILMWVGITELIAKDRQPWSANNLLPASPKPMNYTDGIGSGATNKGLQAAKIAAVIVSGSIVAMVAVLAAAAANIKQISDVMLDYKSYVNFADHGDKIGYQHAVMQDMLLLRQLVFERLQPFRSQSSLWQQYRKVLDHVLGISRANIRYALWTVHRWMLTELAKQYREKAQALVPSLRMVVFIDDLDRCKPSKVVEVLEAVNMVLAGSGFSVVIGMDRGFIIEAVSEAYKAPLIDPKKAEDFLQKIVQVELSLPTLSRQEMAEYLKGLKIDVVVHTPGRGGPVQESGTGSANSSTTGEIMPDRDEGNNAEDPSANEGSTRHEMPATPDSEGRLASGEAMEWLIPSRRYRSAIKSEVPGKGHDSFPQAAQVALQSGLNGGWLDGATPREVKRVVNRYLLAAHIVAKQIEDQKQRDVETQQMTQAEEGKLMGWVLLWWKYPKGMSYVMQHLKLSKPLKEHLQELHGRLPPESVASAPVNNHVASEPHSGIPASEAVLRRLVRLMWQHFAPTAAQQSQLNSESTSEAPEQLPQPDNPEELEQLKDMARMFAAMQTSNTDGVGMWDIEPELAQRFKLFEQH